MNNLTTFGAPAPAQLAQATASITIAPGANLELLPDGWATYNLTELTENGAAEIWFDLPRRFLSKDAGDMAVLQAQTLPLVLAQLLAMTFDTYPTARIEVGPTGSAMIYAQ